MLGLLRANRPLRAYTSTHLHLHSFSTCSRLFNRPLLNQHYQNPLIRTIPSHFVPHFIIRPLSLGSIFGKSATPTPSPAAVVQIAQLEEQANAHPQDASKQVELFQALVDSGVKQGYELVMTRWERLLEFDPKSPVIASDPAFSLYLTSILKTSQGDATKASIEAAVKKRETLLAVIPSPTTNKSTTTPLSGSALIAQSILAGGAAGSKGTTPILNFANGNTGSVDMAKLAAALASGAGAAGNPLHVSVTEPKGAWIPRLVRFVILTCVSGFFILVVLAVLLENSGLLKAGPRSTSQFEPVDGKTVLFSDVHGVDEAKAELQEVVDFLKDPTAFATLGGRLPKGVLLTGSPGTGKTLLARAVAGEAGVPFFFASGSEFEEMFVGVGAKRVRELFAAARKKQPSIIFIDELDAVGGKRNGRDQQYLKQTLNQLLVEMDGFLQSEGIIVIAATNFPESLDQALVRPGRFDRHIAVPLPDIRGRVQILKHHMKEVVSSADADPTVLARGTPGFSGADLQNMVNQAAIKASRDGALEVNLKHFEWAKDRIVMGAERKSSYIDEKAKLMTAYHEGGHALVALYTDGAMPLHKVTCVPRGHALGVTSQLPENDRLSVSLKEYLAEIDVCMGGRVAEELIYGAENVTSGASSDIRHATRTATAMVKSWGFSEKVGPVYYSDHEETISPRRREEIEDEVRTLVKNGEARVIALLKEKEEELHRLAHALVEHETLDSDEVRKVIKGEKLQRIEEIIKEDLESSSEPVEVSTASILTSDEA